MDATTRVWRPALGMRWDKAGRLLGARDQPALTPGETAGRTTTGPEPAPGAQRPADAAMRALRRRGWLDLEAGVLEVEVSLDAVHHIVADHALVAELDDGAALGLEQLAHQPLVGKGAVLVAVLDLAGPSLQARPG